MISQNINIIGKALFNREAVLSMILPALIYGLTYKYFGLIEAVLVSGLYAVVASFFLKVTKYLTFGFALFGMVELCFIGLMPETWIVDTIYIKSLFGSVQIALVFLVFLF